MQGNGRKRTPTSGANLPAGQTVQLAASRTEAKEPRAHGEHSTEAEDDEDDDDDRDSPGLQGAVTITTSA